MTPEQTIRREAMITDFAKEFLNPILVNPNIDPINTPHEKIVQVAYMLADAFVVEADRRYDTSIQNAEKPNIVRLNPQGG